MSVYLADLRAAEPAKRAAVAMYYYYHAAPPTVVQLNPLKVTSDLFVVNCCFCVPRIITFGQSV